MPALPTCTIVSIVFAIPLRAARCFELSNFITPINKLLL